MGSSISVVATDEEFFQATCCIRDIIYSQEEKDNSKKILGLQTLEKLAHESLQNKISLCNRSVLILLLEMIKSNKNEAGVTSIKIIKSLSECSENVIKIASIENLYLFECLVSAYEVFQDDLSCIQHILATFLNLSSLKSNLKIIASDLLGFLDILYFRLQSHNNRQNLRDISVSILENIFTNESNTTAEIPVKKSVELCKLFVHIIINSQQVSKIEWFCILRILNHISFINMINFDQCLAVIKRLSYVIIERVKVKSDERFFIIKVIFSLYKNCGNTSNPEIIFEISFLLKELLALLISLDKTYSIDETNNISVDESISEIIDIIDKVCDEKSIKDILTAESIVVFKVFADILTNSRKRFAIATKVLNIIDKLIDHDNNDIALLLLEESACNISTVEVVMESILNNLVHRFVNITPSLVQGLHSAIQMYNSLHSIRILFKISRQGLINGFQIIFEKIGKENFDNNITTEENDKINCGESTASVLLYLCGDNNYKSILMLNSLKLIPLLIDKLLSGNLHAELFSLKAMNSLSIENSGNQITMASDSLGLLTLLIARLKENSEMDDLTLKAPHNIEIMNIILNLSMNSDNGHKILLLLKSFLKKNIKNFDGQYFLISLKILCKLSEFSHNKDIFEKQQLLPMLIDIINDNKNEEKAIFCCINIFKNLCSFDFRSDKRYGSEILGLIEALSSLLRKTLSIYIVEMSLQIIISLSNQIDNNKRMASTYIGLPMIICSLLITFDSLVICSYCFIILKSLFPLSDNVMKSKVLKILANLISGKSQGHFVYYVFQFLEYFSRNVENKLLMVAESIQLIQGVVSFLLENENDLLKLLKEEGIKLVPASSKKNKTPSSFLLKKKHVALQVLQNLTSEYTKFNEFLFLNIFHTIFSREENKDISFQCNDRIFVFPDNYTRVFIFPESEWLLALLVQIIDKGNHSIILKALEAFRFLSIHCSNILSIASVTLVDLLVKKIEISFSIINNNGTPNEKKYADKVQKTILMILGALSLDFKVSEFLIQKKIPTLLIEGIQQVDEFDRGSLFYQLCLYNLMLLFRHPSALNGIDNDQMTSNMIKIYQTDKHSTNGLMSQFIIIYLFGKEESFNLTSYQSNIFDLMIESLSCYPLNFNEECQQINSSLYHSFFYKVGNLKSNSIVISTGEKVFHLKIVTSALLRLSISDRNKETLICNEALLSSVCELFKSFLLHGELLFSEPIVDNNNEEYVNNNDYYEILSNTIEILLHLSYFYSNESLKDNNYYNNLSKSIDQFLHFIEKRQISKSIEKVKSSVSLLSKRLEAKYDISDSIRITANMHIMFSYPFGVNDLLVDSFHDKFKDGGFEVWKYESGSIYSPHDELTNGDINNFIEAINQCFVVIIFVSRQYKECPRCRFEAIYSNERYKRGLLEVFYIVDYSLPIKSESLTEYNKGWLNQFINKSNSYDLLDFTQSQQLAENISSRINNKFKIKTSNSTTPHKYEQAWRILNHADTTIDLSASQAYLKRYGIGNSSILSLADDQELTELSKLLKDIPKKYFMKLLEKEEM